MSRILAPGRVMSPKPVTVSAVTVNIGRPRRHCELLDGQRLVGEPQMKRRTAKSAIAVMTSPLHGSYGTFRRRREGTDSCAGAALLSTRRNRTASPAIGAKNETIDAESGELTAVQRLNVERPEARSTQMFSLQMILMRGPPAEAACKPGAALERRKIASDQP